jgi:hypothetical protein
MTLLISVSQVARITGMSTSAWLEEVILYTENLKESTLSSTTTKWLALKNKFSQISEI